MIRYRWPPGAPTTRPDDSAGRRAYNARRRAPVELLVAGAAPMPAPGPGLLPRAAPPAGAGNAWLPIGPSVVLNGQAGGRPRVSGRVRDVALSDNGIRGYAATATGGVWYTDDAGVSWSPLGGWVTDANPAPGRNANALSCGCLLVTFGPHDDGTDDEVYVGTGELAEVRRSDGTPGRRMRGIGVLRLGPPDTTFTVLANPFTDPWRREANNLAGHGIYRLARDPADPNRLVAATSAGLFTRSGPFVENAAWSRVTEDPFDFDADDGPFTTDVLWNPASPDGSVPARLWVALVVPGDPVDTGLYVSTAGVDGPFDQVAVAGVTANSEARLGLAAAPSNRSVLYALGTGPRLWRVDGLTARPVTRVPSQLFQRKNALGKPIGGDQSDYDLAIAVKPDDPAAVLLGGSTAQAEGEWSAALFRCAVQGPAGTGPYHVDFSPANGQTPAADPTYVGSGVHADVHQIRWLDRPLAFEVWVACDGGVFRSTQNGDRHSFLPRNTGLAALETHFLGGHPTIESVLLAGTQDNGTLRRTGDTVWTAERLSDGGAVLVHPQRPLRYVYQRSQAKWFAEDPTGSFVVPVFRTAAETDSERTEDVRSSFYSGADIQPAIPAGSSRIVLGTNRVWICEDWTPGTTPVWLTLPAGADRLARDPRAETGPGSGVFNPDDATDVLGGGSVLACRWVGPDRVVALSRRAVNVWTRATPLTGTWKRSQISAHDGTTKSGGRYDNSDIEQPTSPVLPPLGAWSDIAVQDPTAGQHGSYYVATTGHASFDDDDPEESDRMDTLWWYDGNSRWHPTGLRSAAAGTKAPAYAVVVDPADPEVVYAGTAIGVWRGTRSVAGGTPSWQWQPLNAGLPEAAAEDLSFFSHGGRKVLRAALRARGVWEFDLSPTPTPIGRTYLRVHADDHRLTLPSDLVNPTSTIDHDWGSSPDIMLRPSPLNPPPPPPTVPPLPWTKSAFGTRYDLWVLQLGMHFSDATVRPDGVWDDEFSGRVRSFRTRFGLPAGEQVDNAFWTTAVDNLSAWSPPWDGVEPTEADLVELVRERPITFPAPRRTRLDRHLVAVDVLVHRRDSRPLVGGVAAVLLLRRPLAAAENDGAGVPIDAAWRTAVVDRLTGSAAPAALPDGWQVADPSPQTDPTGVRRVSGVLDARRPRPATFTVDWSAVPAGSKRWLLAAVCSAPGDVLTAAALPGATLEELVRGSHHIAVKRVGLP